MRKVWRNNPADGLVLLMGTPSILLEPQFGDVGEADGVGASARLSSTLAKVDDLSPVAGSQLVEGGIQALVLHHVQGGRGVGRHLKHRHRTLREQGWAGLPIYGTFKGRSDIPVAVGKSAGTVGSMSRFASHRRARMNTVWKPAQRISTGSTSPFHTWPKVEV